MMNRKFLVVITVLIANLFMFACGPSISLSMPISVGRTPSAIISEDRPVHGFHAVNFSGYGILKIEQSDRESLTITTEEDLLPMVKTVVKDGVLEIGFDTNRFPDSLSTHMLEFTLNVKNLDDIQVSGIGDVRMGSLKEIDHMAIVMSGAGALEADTLQAQSLQVTLSGAGNIKLSGTVQSTALTLSGAGNFNARELSSQNTRITLSGLGNANVWAVKTLHLTLSGTGSVTYRGTPQVTKYVTGLGNVKPVGN